MGVGVGDVEALKISQYHSAASMMLVLALDVNSTALNGDDEQVLKLFMMMMN